MSKIGLSPVLVAAVAMTTPLNIVLAADTQTTSSVKQATEISIEIPPVVINQQVKPDNPHQIAVVNPVPVVPESEPPQLTPTVKFLKIQSLQANKSVVIGSTSTAANLRAQAPQTTPPPKTPDTKPPATTPENNPPVMQPVLPNTPDTDEPRVLVSEVVIKSPTGPITPELENQVYKVIRTQAGQTTTRSQLQEDINSIFGTGFFSNVQALPEDTPLGVRVSFVVNPNPILTKVNLEANPIGVKSVLPPGDVDNIFREQYGKILNLRDLQDGVKKLTKEYQDKGYVLANLIGSPKVADNGVVTLELAEGVVESIRVRFQKKESKKQTTQDGQEVKGRTQDYIIKRELELKPGQVFNRNMVQKDLKRLFGLGIFEDVNISLDPGTDPSQVKVIVNVVERSSGSIGLGAGISSASGLFGTVSYQQQNIAGRDQKFSAETQVGERDLLFDLRFTDPWIDGDTHRTSYTTDVFRRSTVSTLYEGKNTNINTFNLPTDTAGDVPRIQRVGGGTVFTRPLSNDPYTPSEWTASAGFQYQRVSSRDGNDNIREFGTVYVNNLPTQLIHLTYSGTGQDDLFLFQTSIQRDHRNNPLQPTTGSYLRLGADQSIPLGLGNILFTRLRANYSQYFPVKLLKFSKKAQTLAFNFQAGTLIGDLPPYEAFTLGGSNSVRGYNEGELGSGRSYAQASVEYRFPVFSVISGAVFFDYGTDLGTNTPAAQLLSESGNGYGYGLGLRIQSPLGPIRIDYGINDQGGSRVNFGIGERF